MTPYVSEILLWLFVINLGIVFGAGLYEARIVVPLWASSPPKSLRSPDSGRKFWVFVTTLPLTLLSLANLVAAWQAQGTRRDWWLGAVFAVLVERIATFSYFIPTMLRLQHAATLPASEIKVRCAAMGAMELFAECDHSGSVVGSAESVLVAKMSTAAQTGRETSWA